MRVVRTGLAAAVVSGLFLGFVAGCGGDAGLEQPKEIPKNPDVKSMPGGEMQEKLTKEKAKK
jgi:hypothetical protein